MINGIQELVNRVFGVSSKYVVIRTFPMLHSGWECDGEVALIRVYGETYAVGTNHGAPYILSKSELLDKITEYTRVINDTICAIQEMDELPLVKEMK